MEIMTDHDTVKERAYIAHPLVTKEEQDKPKHLILLRRFNRQIIRSFKFYILKIKKQLKQECRLVK
jgi:hypothetical protein